MDEPTKDNEQLSDSELFDAAVKQEDVVAEQPVVSDEVERTTPHVSAAQERTIPEVTAPAAVEQVTPAPPVVAAPPAAQPQAVATTRGAGNSGGTLVLQWLSYAFWGWFGFSMAVLSGITFGFFMDGTVADSLGGTLAYPLAAVIVMLLISLVTDFFYARHEPAVKTGAANVIMLIHVVFNLLVTVGALITIVFAGISMLLADTNVYSDGHNGQKIAMFTAAVVAVIFGSLSARALFGGRKGGVRKLFWLLMSILALAAIIASITGPAMKLAATKNDRLIEDALPTLVRDINDYVGTNDRLPASLSDVKSTSYDVASKEGVQMMISKNLVTYKPNTHAATDSTTGMMPLNGGTDMKSQSTKVASPDNKFYYQLCVTYQAEKKATYSYPQYSSGYAESISTDSHPKGEKCYDLVASGSYSYNY